MYQSSFRRRRFDFVTIFMIVGLLILVTVVPAIAMMITFSILHAWWAFIPTMPFGVALPLSIVSICSALAVRLGGDKILGR